MAVKIPDGLLKKEEELKEVAKKLEKSVRSKVSDVQKQFNRTKSSVESSYKESKKQVQNRVDRARSNLELHIKHAQKTKSALEAKAAKERKLAEKRIAQLKKMVATKKEAKQLERAISRADRAEEKANNKMNFALAAITEAEVAALEAVHLRMDALELLGSHSKKKKTRTKIKK